MASARLRLSGLTTRASCLLAAGTTAVLCGLVLGVSDLVRAGVLAVTIPAASIAIVLRTRVRIAHRRDAEPRRVEAGHPVTVQLRIANRSLLRTGSLLLEDELPARVRGTARFVIPGLAAREERTVSYRLPALPRGRYRTGPLRIRLTDPFRVIDVMRSFSATTDVLVTPVIDRLPAIEPPRSYDVGDHAGSHWIGTHGADDASTREYRTGDDLRKIHWRSTARAGALMVRLEERPWQGHTTVLLDLRAVAHCLAADGAGDGDLDPRRRDSVEWAVSAAASITTHLMLAGRDVTMVDDGAVLPRAAADTPARLVDHLAAVRPSSRVDLTAIGGALRAASRDAALIAILGRLDAASARTLADIRPRGSTVPAYAMLLDTATWSDGPSDAQLGDPPDGPAGDDAALAAASRALQAAGWTVVTVRASDGIADVWTALLRGGARGRLTGASR
jgi:uncharacterized protein (DUF58 family)